MRFWILERRQEVLTADDLDAEDLRTIVGELDDEQRTAELNQARLRAIVLTDQLTITPAAIELAPVTPGTIASEEAPKRPAARVGARGTAAQPKLAERFITTRKEKQRYPCEFCEESFGWAPGRASHERNKHPSEVAERKARRGHPAGSIKQYGPQDIVQKGGKRPPNPPPPARVVATPPGPPPSNGKSKWRGVEDQPQGTMAERLEAAKRRREAGLA